MNVLEIINKIYNNNGNFILDEKDYSVAINFDKKKFQKINFKKYELLLDEFYYNVFLSSNKLDYNMNKVNDYYHLTLNNKYLLMDDFDAFTKAINQYKILIDKNVFVKPKLALHSCCGPCSSYCLTFLKDYFDITVLYYNPNIYPEEEFNKRLETQKEIIDKLPFSVKLVSCDYDYNEYLNGIKGYDNDHYHEGSVRCYNCYKLRMDYLAKYALDNGYDYFTTTLSVSPYKNSKWINEIGSILEEKYNVKYLYSDFKRNDGYKESIRLSKEYHLYRQEYCGCEFSLKEKKEE